MGSFKLKLVTHFLLLALLPAAAAAYGYHRVATRSEVHRVDARLLQGLRAVRGGYVDLVASAREDLRSLARQRSFQQTLLTEDVEQLERLVEENPNLVIRVNGRSYGGGTRSLAVSHSELIPLWPGSVAEVEHYVPLDAPLLARLKRRAGLERADSVVLVRDGRVVAGAGFVANMLDVRRDRPVVVRLGGSRYRALASAPVRAPAGGQLVLLSPQASVEDAVASTQQRVLAIVLALMILIAGVTYLFGRTVVRTLARLADAANAIAHGSFGERVEVRGRDEFAQLGRAFNQMAAQLEERIAELEAERARLRESTSRFGEALAATHDPDQLMRIVVHTAVEATGADGGVLVTPEGVLVQVGEPRDDGDRLELPLLAGRDNLGTLFLSGKRFGAEEREAAVSLVAQTVVALENAKLHRIVERQALVDGLTGIANRRHAEDALHAEVSRAGRFSGEVAFVLADLDDFKGVNDRFGHPTGDAVLREFALLLQETVREIDVAARWGGEEFALVLPGTDLEGGAAVAERARAVLEARPILTADGTIVRVTASFGVAAYPDHADEAALVAAADAALYDAKRDGKNRVAVDGAPVR